MAAMLIRNFRFCEEADKHPEWFCPITTDRCNSNCMWAIKTECFEDDGVEVFHECAMTVALGRILEDQSGDDQYE